MVLTYKDGSGAKGKATDNADVVEGRFVELRPQESMVQQVEFESDDPAFAGTMMVCWRLARVGEATLVSITAEDVPPGIHPEDHSAGMGASLANLAAYVE